MSCVVILEIIAFIANTASVQIDPSVFRLVIIQGYLCFESLCTFLTRECDSFMFIHVSLVVDLGWEISLTLTAPELELSCVLGHV